MPTPAPRGVEAQLDRLTLIAQEMADGTGVNAVDLTQKLFLGAFATNPVTDNQGQAILTGARYFNTVSQDMLVWSGTAWLTVDGSGAQPASVNLAALAGLALVANRGLFSTGPGALALYALTSFGRTLAGSADPAAARGHLELGTAALADLIPFSLLDPALIVDDVEGLAGNESPTRIPVAKAITDYIASVSSRPFCAGSLNTRNKPTGTYVQSGTTITVTMTAHGMLTGQAVWLNFTTGTAVDGFFFITVTGVNTFTVTAAAPLSTSGNVTREMWARALRGVASILYTAAGNSFEVTFTEPQAQPHYMVFGTTSTDNGSRIPIFGLYEGTPSPIRTTGFTFTSRWEQGSGGGNDNAQWIFFKCEEIS